MLLDSNHDTVLDAQPIAHTHTLYLYFRLTTPSTSLQSDLKQTCRRLSQAT